MRHGHFIEFARMCGHLVATCKCIDPDKTVRFRAGLCADCAVDLSREKTRHHFPNSVPKEEPRPPRLHVDEYRRQVEVRKVEQAQIPLFDAAEAQA